MLHRFFRSLSVTTLLAILLCLPVASRGAPQAGTPPAPEQPNEAAAAPVPAPSQADQQLVEEIMTSVVVPSLGSRRQELATSEGVAASSDFLRDLWGRMEKRLAEQVPLERRAQLLEMLRVRFVDRLASAVTGDEGGAVARTAVSRARLEWLNRRKLLLFESIKNWCPNEDWAFTLADCSDDKTCARPQKRMIQEWLDEGLTDAEIRQRMVEEAGTDKVLVHPVGAFSRAAPYVFFFAGVGVIAAILWRLRAGPRQPMPLDTESAATEGAESSSAGEDDLDPRWEARLEEELRKSEDSR